MLKFWVTAKFFASRLGGISKQDPFFVSQPAGRGFEPLLRHTFFAKSVSRKISRCLAGVLLYILCEVCNLCVKKFTKLIHIIILKTCLGSFLFPQRIINCF